MRISDGELIYLAARGAHLEQFQNQTDGREELATFYGCVLKTLEGARNIGDVLLPEKH